MLKGAKHIIKTLNSNGFSAYMIGGCVRDIIMNNSPSDYDIATSAEPNDIIKIFKKTIPTGLKHGTVTVIENGFHYEVTTYRIDGSYINNRKPENVYYTKDLKEDIKRRDFTINSIAYNDDEGFIDYFEGIKDIDNKIIKTVQNPIDRFNEDALRILRGIRFATRFGFSIENETFDAMKKLNYLISKLSSERIFTELERMFSLSPYESSILLYKIGFFDIMNFKISQKDIEKLKKLKNKSFIMSFSVLTYNNANYRDYLIKLKCSNKIKSDVTKLISSLSYNLNSKYDLKIMLKKLKCEELVDEIEELRIISGNGCCEAKKLYTEILSNNECYTLKDLAVNGEDALKLGIPAERIGKILDTLLDKVIENHTLNDKKILIKLMASL